MQTTLDLFASLPPEPPRAVQIGTHAWVLTGFALPYVDRLLQALASIEAQAPFRQMITPGGFTMSVGLTNCGALGWTTDRHGYRYATHDPESRQPWPSMPAVFLQLAEAAAAAAGFADFVPDACLINRYVPSARLSLHQDKDERSYDHPIVSVSLGIPATFLFGGHTRSAKAQRIGLMHGDIVVWGGEDRLRYHGVLPLKPAEHPLLGEQRINFTLRKAG
jgi:alkylated DNA repair protein (DNA oxidative demethylase)